MTVVLILSILVGELAHETLNFLNSSAPTFFRRSKEQLQLVGYPIFGPVDKLPQ